MTAIRGVTAFSDAFIVHDVRLPDFILANVEPILVEWESFARSIWTITVTELFRVAQQVAATTYEPLVLYSEAAFVYLLFSTVLSSLQGWMEKRFSRHVAQ
jgi:ABC-type arginine transport system permease subunit